MRRREGDRFHTAMPADREELRSCRGRRRHQRARRGLFLSPCRRAAGADPGARQLRRFRRPRQAQRVHHADALHHRLWRQPVDAVARDSVSQAAKGLLRDLGVDIERFETAFDRNLYPSLGLPTVCSSPRGVRTRRPVAGDPLVTPGDGDSAPTQRPSELIRGRSADFRCQQGAVAWRFTIRRAIRSPGGSRGETPHPQDNELSRLFDRILRLRRRGRELLPGPHARFFRPGCDAVPAGGLRAISAIRALPGSAFRDEPIPSWQRALYLSFPRRQCVDCPATGARAGAGVAPGGTMDDIVLAPFDYDRLDRPGDECASASIHRVDVRDAGAQVLVGYMRGGEPASRGGKHAVLACFHAMIPYLMPELPAEQRAGAGAERQDAARLHQRDRAQLAAWASWESPTSSAPMSFQPHRARLSGQSRRLSQSARSVRADAAAHGACARCAQPGLDARAQFRPAGKAAHHDIRGFRGRRIRDELDRMLGPGGFSSERDIAAITVNRWSHGYGYMANTLFDGDDYADTMRRARKTSAASPSPIPTPAGMPMRIWPSIRPAAPCAIWWVGARIGDSARIDDIDGVARRTALAS